MPVDPDQPVESLRSARRLVLALGVVLCVLVGLRFAWLLLPGDADRYGGSEEPLEIEAHQSGSIELVRRQPETPDSQARVGWRAGLTVADATRIAGDQPGWVSEWRGEGPMAFLDSLGGTPNQGGEGLNWQFEVNDRYATEGAGAVTLQPGDRVLWKLAPYE